LHSDFTRALDTFQRAQRQAAQKEKDVIRSVGNFLNSFRYLNNRSLDLDREGVDEN
jgi:hypothetical protein